MLYQDPIRPKIRRDDGFLSQYEVHEKLGSGYSATVFRSMIKTSQREVALKRISHKMREAIVAEAYYEDLLRELMVLKHRNLCGMNSVWKTADHYYQEIELCKGQDMVDFVLSFPPGGVPLELTKNVLRQLLGATKYLHANGIIHRDLKLDNLMLIPDGQVLKVIDFDMSYILGRPPLKDSGRVPVVGTREYMAPEGYSGQCSYATDIWSIGVIMYIMLDGHFPFDFSKCQRSRDYMRVLAGGVKLTSHLRRNHAQALELIKGMLHPDPTSRPPAARLLECPWFKAQEHSPTSLPDPCWSANATPLTPVELPAISTPHQASETCVVPLYPIPTDRNHSSRRETNTNKWTGFPISQSH